jgi:hypothetical protein
MLRKPIVYLLLSIILLTSCAPTPVPQDPGMVFTVVASTQTVAAWQTQMAESSFTSTPTQATLRPTFTPPPTMTSFVYEVTPSPTFTPTPSPTSTKPVLTSWPDWKTGDVVTMEKGSGENIGVNKKFYVLEGVNVIVIRGNGVGLRSIPSKAASGPQEDYGSILTLTGIMNKNSQYGWFFAQVVAENGQTYWVGGDEGSDKDPRESFMFYYPRLTASSTPLSTDTATPSRTPTVTPTETLTETATP